MTALEPSGTTSPDLKRIVEALTRAGGQFEMVSAVDAGRPFRVWKNGPQTLVDIFLSTRPFEDREFLVLADERVTYGAFRRATMKFAGWLQDRSIGPGDVVAIMMPNRPEWLTAYFATALTGAIGALINPAASPAELAHSFSLSRPRIVACTADTLERVISVVPDCPSIECIVVADEANPLDWAEEARVEQLERIIGAPAEWNALADGDIKLVRPQPSDRASILFTAGTTGHPKGVVLSHRSCACSVFHAAFRNARRAALSVDQATGQPAEQQVLLMVLPLFHTSGICNAVLPLMMRGGRIVMMSHWSPKLAMRLAQREGVHILGTVPMIAEQMAGEVLTTGARVVLQQIICGGGPPSSHLATRIAEAGAVPGQNWGMTETAGALVGLLGAEFLTRPKSCGLPAPIHDLRIVSSDGRELSAGEIGELQVRGPQVMIEYLNDPDETARAIADGWLKTGDLAYLDEDGYCFIVDRAKDMLICAGENVYCIEIENVLAAHPDVDEVAVFGIPHPLMGEQPVAVITRRKGSELTGQAARIFAAKQLQIFKTPNRIIVQDEALPRNRLGKIQKADLRGLFDE